MKVGLQLGSASASAALAVWVHSLRGCIEAVCVSAKKKQKKKVKRNKGKRN